MTDPKPRWRIVPLTPEEAEPYLETRACRELGYVPESWVYVDGERVPRLRLRRAT